MYFSLRVSLIVMASWSLGAQALEPVTSPSREGKDFALFFAVDTYQDAGWNNLKNPVRDAEAIAAELKSHYNFEAEIHRNISKAETREVLIQWQNKHFEDDAQLLVFFTGHGSFSERNKQGYFVPPEGTTNDTFNDSHFLLSEIGNMVTNIPCNHILLTIDACYSGTIDQKIAFKSGKEPKRFGEDSTMKQKRTIVHHLSRKSRLLLTSGGKERTPDGNEHSPFSKGLLDALDFTYTKGDGILSWIDLLGFMQDVHPTPYHGHLFGHDGGSFVFVAEEGKRLNPSDQGVPTGPFLDPQFIHIKGGTFSFGNKESETTNSPPQIIRISDFEIGKYEITVKQFKEFMDNVDPPYRTDAEKEGGSEIWRNGEIVKDSTICWKHDAEGNLIKASDYNQPVIHVSWNDAQAFCAWLGKKKEGNYRLPSEAEWQFAAGNGSEQTTFSWGKGDIANQTTENLADESFKEKFPGFEIFNGYRDTFIFVAPVGRFNANGFQLHDMTGNVKEWCQDGVSIKRDSISSDGSIVPGAPGGNKIIRGGSYCEKPDLCKVTSKQNYAPDYRSYDIGFRIVREK